MIQLRMRGLPPSLFASALIAAWPGVFVVNERFARGAVIEPLLFWLCLGVVAVPWASRLVARLSYRAAVDDVALHVAGDALPWNTITRVREVKSWRRTILVVERGRTSRFTLVTRDLFAGRLEPIDELWRRLPEAVRPERPDQGAGLAKKPGGP